MMWAVKTLSFVLRENLPVIFDTERWAMYYEYCLAWYRE